MSVGSGATVMHSSVGDTPFFLDGAWRILHGHVPHTDFSSYIGSFSHYVTALGVRICGPRVLAIVWGKVIFCIAFLLAAYPITSARMSPVRTFVLLLFFAAVILATRQQGDAYYEHAYSGVYNRFADVTLGLLGVMCFISPRAGSRWCVACEAILFGPLLTLLLLSKTTYFLAGVGLVAVALLVGRVRGRSLLLVAVSFVASAAAVLLLTRINVGDMLHDYLIVGGSGHANSRLLGVPGQLVRRPLPFLFLGLLVVEDLAARTISEKGIRHALRRALPAAVLAGAALFIAATNGQRPEFPLLAVAGLILTEQMSRQAVRDCVGWPLTGAVRGVLSFLVALMILFPIMNKDLQSLAHTAKITAVDAPCEWPSYAAGIRDFRIQGHLDYRSLVKEGLALLYEHAAPDTKVLAIDWSDPFAFALGLPPARGGCPFWVPALNFSEETHQDPRQVFGDADMVMVAKQTAVGKLARKVYGEYWETACVTLDESEQWLLLATR